MKHPAWLVAETTKYYFKSLIRIFGIMNVYFEINSMELSMTRRIHTTAILEQSASQNYWNKISSCSAGKTLCPSNSRTTRQYTQALLGKIRWLVSSCSAQWSEAVKLETCWNSNSVGLLCFGLPYKTRTGLLDMMFFIFFLISAKGRCSAYVFFNLQ